MFRLIDLFVVIVAVASSNRRPILPTEKMSWLVNSIANSLKLDDDDDGDDDDDAAESTASSGDEKQRSPPDDEIHSLSPSDDDALRRGVKEDLSEFSKTFTRQLWGVASFLAPPPSDSQISDPNPQSLDRSEGFDEDDSSSVGIAGIRSDLSEIGGRFRTGISKLSTNKAVSEFSKIASNFLQLVSEEGESLEDYTRRGVAGVTEEVVAFARDVAMHPQTWLDFPLPDNYDDKEEDFEMLDIQQEHALAIQHLAPSLAALRKELCPGYMSEGYFWKIYFVLVHPRLTSQDAELLSTSQIVKARSLLTPELRTNKSIPEGSGRGIDTLPSEASSSTNEEHLTVASNSPESVPVNISVIVEDTSMDTANIVVDKHALASTEIPVIEEVYVAQSNNENPSSQGIDSDNQCDEDADEWLKEELPEMGSSSGTAIPIEDDDVSFSDLEEEEEEISIK